jgi:hypothetical protein
MAGDKDDELINIPEVLSILPLAMRVFFMMQLIFAYQKKYLETMTYQTCIMIELIY